MSKPKKQNTKNYKKKLRNDLSDSAVQEFYKLIESLDPEIIIITMQCELNHYDRKSFINVRLANVNIFK